MIRDISSSQSNWASRSRHQLRNLEQITANQN